MSPRQHGLIDFYDIGSPLMNVTSFRSLLSVNGLDYGLWAFRVPTKMSLLQWLSTWVGRLWQLQIITNYVS